ncbi:ABC transporter C family member 4-like [Aegilops tauschii subsp. strangulata]|uniref:ABC transporter C family member 4-like n=1 Tax=Aegilops tauschii subsp. strangulata TaxID=200361 RepID=UPI00098A57E9|nr:ABC transporter C family member 14-like [Aegilops tauschii subsp. strangulata]
MGGGGPPWWLATTECSPPPSSDSFTGGLAFLLSPCPQRALLGVIDLIFLAASLVLALCRCGASGASPEKEPLAAVTDSRRAVPGHRPPSRRARCIRGHRRDVRRPTRARDLSPAAVVESAFLAVHFAAHAAAAWTVIASAAAAAHPPHLRVFWIATLFSASAAVRCADGSPLLPDDVLAFAGLLLSLPLAYIAITTCTARDEQGEQDQNPSAAAATTTPYVTASFLSRATFSWMNPLVSKWHANESLADTDVPPELAGGSAGLFLLIAAPGLVQLAAMYVGPSPIDRFVEFIHRGGTPLEGLRLVAILIAGKASLRLSTGAARAHGAGAIMNYMQVDASMVSGAMHGLHGLWLVPLQIAVALFLLYAYLGPAVLMTLAVIAAVVVVTAFANKLNLGYQFRFFGARDSRVKALTEMLGHMRVINLQAWEETFGDKVRELWRAEVRWLKKVILFVCGTNVVYSSGPIAMTVLVFGTYLTAGGELDAGKVFTATAFFRMLEGPMSNFPQTIVMSMQAFVSLGRLDKFLADAEIDTTAVERPGSGAAGDEVAVKVQCGVFAWDVQGGDGEEKDGGGEEPVLKGIEVEVRKGGARGGGRSGWLRQVVAAVMHHGRNA